MPWKSDGCLIMITWKICQFFRVLVRYNNNYLYYQLKEEGIDTRKIIICDAKGKTTDSHPGENREILHKNK